MSVFLAGLTVGWLTAAALILTIQHIHTRQARAERRMTIAERTDFYFKTPKGGPP